jgi:putative nucleotidyltransferase with HDIG domain
MGNDRDRYSILIVEDDPVVREMLNEIVQENGNFFVKQAKDGKDALSILENIDIDAIISDINLPRMDGIELLKNVKKLYPLVPMALITGFPSIDIAVNAMKEGASDFIVKPFDMNRLMLLIHKLIQERNILLENSKLNKSLKNRREIDFLNESLSNKVKELTLLYKISEAFNTVGFDKDTICEKILSMASEITGSRKASLMLIDPFNKTLKIKAFRGIDPKIAQKTSIRLGEGIAGRVALEGKPILVEDIFHSPYFRDSYFGDYQSASFMSVPLLIKGEVIGVINVADKYDGDKFHMDELRLLVMLAQRGALSLENHALYESVYRNLMETLYSLVSTIEAKDPYTKLHSQRVTRLAVAIAEAMELPKEDIEVIKFAGILHDIGKIGIPDSILLKPARLNAEEYNIIKTHPSVGGRIIEPLNLLPKERELIRHHHERWDGTGYPDRLSREDIPLLARILSIADSYDAITSDRVYRKAKDMKDAIDEIRRCAGTQFDPAIVDVFCKLMDGKGPPFLVPPSPTFPYINGDSFR